MVERNAQGLLKSQDRAMSRVVLFTAHGLTGRAGLHVQMHAGVLSAISSPPFENYGCNGQEVNIVPKCLPVQVHPLFE